jgi:hypothetical protein
MFHQLIYDLIAQQIADCVYKHEENAIADDKCEE